MKRNKRNCSLCDKEISLSNYQKHINSCNRKDDRAKKPKLSRHEIQMSLPPKFRQERASKAVRKRNENYRKLSESRVYGSVSFDELNGVEKRRRILLEQNTRCIECGIGEEWNGKPLKLELDHIDGVTQNNNRDNLRMICPNCHQQTPTYKNKNRGQERKSYSDEEIIKALYNNNSGYAAMKNMGMNPHGGNYVRLRNIIKEFQLKLNYSV